MESTTIGNRPSIEQPHGREKKSKSRERQIQMHLNALPSFTQPLKTKVHVKPTHAREIREKQLHFHHSFAPSRVTTRTIKGETGMGMSGASKSTSSSWKISKLRQTVECACHPLIAQPRCTPVGVFTRVRVTMMIFDRVGL